ncbi:MAG: YggT family protein [Clostridium sp.]|nr:YggT family protein [Clostridium sp.]
MQHYLVYTLYFFFIILMIINLIYMLRGIIPLGSFINNILDNLMKPLLCPVRYLVKHSILKCIKVDISPYIILIVLSYLQAVCKYFLV